MVPCKAQHSSVASPCIWNKSQTSHHGFFVTEPPATSPTSALSPLPPSPDFCPGIKSSAGEQTRIFLAGICTGHLYLSEPRLSFPQSSTGAPPTSSSSQHECLRAFSDPRESPSHCPGLLLGRAYCCLNSLSLYTWPSLVAGKLKVPPVCST